MSKQFGYYDDWKTAILHCERCGWTGKFEEGSVEIYNELMDSSCPVCDPFSAPILAIVSFPTIEESEANWEKLSDSEKQDILDRKRFLAAFETSKLKDETQLPNLEGDSITILWDFLSDKPDSYVVLKCGEKEIWREIASYESYERFKEVVTILKKKYGVRLVDVIPTSQSEDYLYGDALNAVDYVEEVRKSIKG